MFLLKLEKQTQKVSLVCVVDTTQIYDLQTTFWLFFKVFGPETWWLRVHKQIKSFSQPVKNGKLREQDIAASVKKRQKSEGGISELYGEFCKKFN